MAGNMVRIHLPGYIAEKLKSGNIRHRVRIEGVKDSKITIPCGPGEPDFHRYYNAARAGIHVDKSESAAHVPMEGSVDWLVRAYLAHLTEQVKIGDASPYTLKQREGLAKHLLNHKSSSKNSSGKLYRQLPMAIPQSELIIYRDSMMGTPGKAKNSFKFLKAMFKWAVDRGYCAVNPAEGITVKYRSQGGATPWTMDDLEKFKKSHPFGSNAHLALTLFMFTACRIGDAISLGRANEFTHNGRTWLRWQPSKKGSKLVEIPMMPPLERAIKTQTIVGPTYIMTEKGQPFKSPEGLRNKMASWCKEAELSGRSSHGIRKAAGHLLALNGATQYEIMSIHGHAQAATSQVYTDGVERTRLADQAMDKLKGMDW